MLAFIHFYKFIVILIYEKFIRIAIMELYVQEVRLGGVSLIQDLLSGGIMYPFIIPLGRGRMLFVMVVVN